MRRDLTQGGFEIDLSATEALFRLLDPLAVEHEILGIKRTHVGNQASYTAPSNMYQTKDGKWVTLVASSDPIFKRLCEAINKPEWASNQKFHTNPQRCINAKELDLGISQWFVNQNYSEIELIFNQAAIPYTKVYDIQDVLNDPQVKARDGIIRLSDKDLGSIPAPCSVPRISDIPKTQIKTGPNTGEDNSYFYKGLGLSDEEVESLRKSSII